ncbi:unnamed protein product [Spirodela intermedia]|uniref:SF4 helicase domain-containing protein n=1 Tax=Spirodela intermedia TaxID=51605 RepID=A0A7I8JIC6_SPIIN|nr:unnamed protein product [Spirodela intermedia]CAA6669870.1 unnamed protein product [Spirodela intermedia]
MPPAAGKTFQNFIHSSVLMGSSKHLVGKHPAWFAAPLLPYRYHRRLLREYLHLISRAHSPLRMPRLCHVRAYSPTSLARAVLPGTLEEAKTNAMQLEILRKKLEEQGISCGSCKPGQYTRMLCPKEKNTERIFYGLDDIKQATDIIIVEGEIDKLSLEEAGFRNCVSVPDGAPAQVSKNLPEEREDTKYQYLWNCKEYLEKASRIILATDSDKPGQALAEELARRLGKERCWRVTWPKKNNVEVFKDANEVRAIEDAELYPIKGLFRFSSYFHEIDSYYNLSHGNELGVVPGELTIVTGVPNSGKSEWIDALLCNLNEAAGWTFALCSMENKVREHARKLLEKHIKKPFFNARYGASFERMTIEDLEQGKEWLDNTFHLIRCEDDCLPSINWVLNLAKAAVLRHGVRGLVIDPYNELDHQRQSNQTETEYVSQMLTKIKRFAQHHSCHVWFVAHPRQLQNWTGSAPNLYDISGSAHFMNKCDNGVVIHRNRDESAGPLDSVKVCVRKVRNKVAGKIGDAFLSYDSPCAEYRTPNRRDFGKCLMGVTDCSLPPCQNTLRPFFISFV